MTPDEAVANRRAMHAAVDDIDVLHNDVRERLAIRDPDGSWGVMHCGDAVRLFLGYGEDATLSRYVWHWRDTDNVIDHLTARANSGAAKKPSRGKYEILNRGPVGPSHGVQ